VVVTKVVVEPSGKTDVMVTGTDVVERLPDGGGAVVLSVAPAVGDGESESSSAVVATNVGSGVVEGVSVSVADASVVDTVGEVVIASVETGIEVAEVVVMPASVDTVWLSVWPGGATEPVVESLLGAAMTESFPPPELDGGGGGDWPLGRTTYVQSLSSRTDWAPSPPIIGVRVTLHVCVIVPT
jgi:hypothetical protein